MNNKIMDEKRKQFISKLTLLKHEAMELGLYSTARCMDIAVQEVGWEVQGKSAPKEAKRQQRATLFVGS